MKKSNKNRRITLWVRGGEAKVFTIFANGYVDVTVVSNGKMTSKIIGCID